MMSLFEMAQESLNRLTKIEAARDGVEEAKALECLRSELNILALNIKQLANNTKLLRTKGVNLSSMPEISPVIGTVSEVTMRFSEVPKAATLRRGTRWTGLTKKLDGLAKQVTEAQTKDWCTYFENKLLDGIHTPQQRSATLAPTPQNKKEFERYKGLFQILIQYQRKIPQNSDEFNNMRAWSEQLVQIKFQDDVPVDVRKFFDATNTGAGLELLTDEVIKWLRSNNLLGSYVVRARIS